MMASEVDEPMVRQSLAWRSVEEVEALGGSRFFNHVHVAGRVLSVLRLSSEELYILALMSFDVQYL